MSTPSASSGFLCISIGSLLLSFSGFLHAADFTPTADYAPEPPASPAPPPTAKPAPTPEVAVDTFIARRTLTDGPGMAVLVARDGKILFKENYGLANAETSQPITSTTKFRIGAVTSQFTAAAILKLQEQGKLKTTDPLDRYFSGFPRGHEVTIHHLLTHTSGIHSYTQDPDFKTEVSNPITADALFKRIKKYGPDFTPGLMWSYSSSGYVILGRIIEKVSGKSYEAFLQENFFKPLGMVNTGVYRNDAPPKDAAAGYAYRGRSYKPALPWDMSWTSGAASLYSTVEDLFRWNEAVFTGAVLNAESREKAFLPVKTEEYGADQANNGYGYGWSVSSYRGARMIYHGGGLDGFSSYLVHLPDWNTSIVILANALPLQGRLEIEQIGKKIIEIYFENELERPPGEVAVKALRPEMLGPLVGRYDFGTVVMQIMKEGDHLMYKLGKHQALELVPKSDTEFSAKAAEVELKFVKDESGKVTQVTREQNGQTQVAPRIQDVAVIKLEDSKLESFLGDYDYGHGIKGRFSADQGRVFGQLTGQHRFEIGAESENEFVLLTANGRITFVKDEKGRVLKLIHRQDGEVREALKIETPQIGP